MKKLKCYFIKQNPFGSGSCEIGLAIDVSIQGWTSKSHSAVFWFIFQLFVKLPTVTQKAAKSPNDLRTYTVQHHLSYLGLSWAFFLHEFTFHLCYITYTIAQSSVIACLAKDSWAWLNQLRNPNNRCDTDLAIGTWVFNGKSVQLTYWPRFMSFSKQYIHVLHCHCCVLQGAVIICVPMEFLVSTFNGMHLRMNVSPLIVCPVQRCFANENRGSISSWSSLVTHILMTCTVSLFCFTSTWFIMLFCVVTFYFHLKEGDILYLLFLNKSHEKIKNNNDRQILSVYSKPDLAYSSVL